MLYEDAANKAVAEIKKLCAVRPPAFKVTPIRTQSETPPSSQWWYTVSVYTVDFFLTCSVYVYFLIDVLI